MIPGSALLVDDQLDKMNDESRNLWNLIVALNKKGIPVLTFSSYYVNEFKELIRKSSNIRLVILDLDLDGDGNVSDADEEVIKNFLKILLDKYGYFFLFIYSAHKEKWEDIKGTIMEELGIESSRVFFENMVFEFQKGDDIRDVIIQKIRDISSLSLFYGFEGEFNKARDNVARNFIEFDKETWKYILCNQKKEVGDLWMHELAHLLLALIKHNLTENISFPVELTEDCDSVRDNYSLDMISKVYRAFNYIDNIPSNVIFTGNLYQTNYEDTEKEYALIITPACDIAQNRNTGKFVVVYGFNVNDNFHSDYDRASDNPPLYVRKAGKDRNRPNMWRTFNSLNKIKNPNQYIYLLPFAIKDPASESYTHVALDFRIVETVPEELVNSWHFKLRLNDPLMVDIQDKFSNLFNRVGLPTLLPGEIKLINEDEQNS